MDFEVLEHLGNGLRVVLLPDGRQGIAKEHGVIYAAPAEKPDFSKWSAQELLKLIGEIRPKL